MSLDIKITLTPEQIKEAIALYLKDFRIEDISFNLKTVSTGFGRDEHDEKVFAGAVASVTPKNTNTSFNSLASQIASVDGGADDLEKYISIWQAGMNGEIPKELKELRTKFTNAADPEYQELLRLADKFGKELS